MMIKRRNSSLRWDLISRSLYLTVSSTSVLLFVENASVTHTHSACFPHQGHLFVCQTHSNQPTVPLYPGPLLQPQWPWPPNVWVSYQSVTLTADLVSYGRRSCLLNGCYSRWEPIPRRLYCFCLMHGFIAASLIYLCTGCLRRHVQTLKRILLKMSQSLTGLLRFSVPSAAAATTLCDVPARQSAVASGAKVSFRRIKKRKEKNRQKNKKQAPNQTPSEETRSMDWLTKLT